MFIITDMHLSHLGDHTSANTFLLLSKHLQALSLSLGDTGGMIALPTVGTVTLIVRSSWTTLLCASRWQWLPTPVMM